MTLNAGLRKWQAERRADAAEHVVDEEAWCALRAAARLRAAKARRAARVRSDTAGRRAAKLQRTPAWADVTAIRALHEEANRLTRVTGVPHEVDHILPLRGRLVSGLHVHTNMRVIPARENARKGNSYEVDV